MEYVIKNINGFYIEIALWILGIFAFIWFWAILSHKPKKRGRHTYPQGRHKQRRDTYYHYHSK